MDNETELKLLKSLMKDCFWLDINLNDVFAWGCADCEQIDIRDIKYILPIYEKYGNASLYACASLLRTEGEGNMLPQPPLYKLIKKEFDAAMLELKPLLKDGKIMLDLWYRKWGQFKK